MRIWYTLHSFDSAVVTDSLCERVFLFVFVCDSGSASTTDSAAYRSVGGVCVLRYVHDTTELKYMAAAKAYIAGMSLSGSVDAEHYTPLARTFTAAAD